MSSLPTPISDRAELMGKAELSKTSRYLESELEKAHQEIDLLQRALKLSNEALAKLAQASTSYVVNGVLLSQEEYNRRFGVMQ